MRLSTSHGEIQFQGHPKSALKCFQCMASGQHWETSLSQRVMVGSQEMVGEETHVSRDAVKLNDKEAPLWSVGMPLVGRWHVGRKSLITLIRLCHRLVLRSKTCPRPCPFLERDPHPAWPVWLREFIPEARGHHGLLLRRGSGHGAKSSWPFTLGQGWGGPFHAFPISKGHWISLPEHWESS